MHGALIAGTLLWPGAPLVTITRAVSPKYSVRFVHLQMPQEFRTASSESVQERAERARMTRIKDQRGVPSEKAGPDGVFAPTVAREPRRFQLPPHIRQQPAKQTLVQMDLPPDLVLKEEIPLPTALAWTQTIPPPATRQLVAPPLNKIPDVTKSLPAAPALDAPNRETEVANLNFASAPVNGPQHLIHPPTIASPVSTEGREPAREIPQIGLASSSQPSASNLIALSNTPLRPTPVLVVPPANQIAPSDLAGAGGSPGGGSRNSDQRFGAREGGSASAAPPGASRKESDSSVSKSNSGPVREPATTASSSKPAVNPNAGVRPAGPEARATNPSVGNTPPANMLPANTMAGVTRITMPRDGKFGVVVQGSADSTRYPESAGALTGKVVYTVYLRVGLRKNWILQYCLPKSAARLGSTPVDAPWPFEMLRPDRWGSSDSDYVMVKGMLTSGGQFEQLAMVFPEDLETRDLLLSSLKGWAFRPASRDGEATAVEVLLIIPRQTE